MKLVTDQATVDVNRIAESITGILHRTQLCAISSWDSHSAYINTAFFCFNEDLQLFVISDPRSQHSRNFELNQSAAVAVYNSEQQWQDLKAGLQMFGTCRAARKDEVTDAARLYEERFPAFGTYIRSLSGSDRNSINESFLMFETQVVKVFDEPAYGEETFYTVRVAR
jgi:uncharacterized protein YhbP (UPF0306 family)